MAVVASLFRLNRRARDDDLELARATAESTLRLAAFSQQLEVRREPILVLDYVDRELLEEIARQKGIQVGNVTWEVGTVETSAEEHGADVSAELRMPGAGLEGRVSTRESRQRARSRAKASEVSYNARTILRELLDVLERDGELRRDLALVPKETESEAMLLGGLMIAYSDWGLDHIPDDHPMKALDKAIDLLADEAQERIATAKTAELRSAAPQRGEVKFAVAETEWAVSGDTSGLVLHNEWLVDLDQEGKPIETVLIPGLLDVPIDIGKLSSMGRQRLKPESSRWLRVFGKIDIFEDGTLTLLPIAIWPG